MGRSAISQTRMHIEPNQSGSHTRNKQLIRRSAVDSYTREAVEPLQFPGIPCFDRFRTHRWALVYTVVIPSVEPIVDSRIEKN